MIGVDGGGTKSVIRIENNEGTLLGETISGPANIRLSVEQAWQSIMYAITHILNDLKIQQSDYYFHAGMGLAGTELTEAYDAFIRFPHTFDSLVVKSDAHIACLAAHGGEDGAIIIVGTGVVGYQIVDHRITKVGGWGFPHDDEGGGAWLGLEAIKVVLRWLDHRLPRSGLASAIFAYFNQDRDYIIHWASHASSTVYAKLAPIVIQQSQLGDEVALNLLKHAAKTIDHLGMTLIKQTHNQFQKKIPISFIGGIAPFLQPFLSEELKEHVRPSQYSCAKGAILMIHQALMQSEYLS